MINAKNFLGQCLLAIALAGNALAVMAAPTSYHVAVNTAGLSGTGSLDMFLGSGTSALALTATLSNFSANFGAVDPAFSGDYTVEPGGSFSLVNGSGYNDLTRFLNLGGTASFDVAFSGAFIDAAGSEGGLFTVGLYDENGNFVGNPLGIASIELVATSPTAFNIAFEPGLASVTAITASAVPEPSALLMMMTGLGLVGFIARRRNATGV
ncbi:MAG: hypothetical protein JWP34_1885 [Massilia sp.]|jgi:hypothetical protein|nr:hypothetical protein [Massilia sp.]